MKSPVSFFAMLFILLFAVIGFIFIVFELKGISFAFELALLLAFMFFLAFGMFLAYSGKSASWGIIAAVLALLLLNVSIIFFITQSFGWKYIITIIFALAGFVAALIKIITSAAKEPKAESHYDKKQYYYPLSEKAEAKEELKEAIKEEVKEEVKSELKKEQRVSAAFTPGKYVASKKAGTFHIAKCDWAARIGKQNRIWFNSKEEAISKGYSEHKCLA